jgi:hypothetical protein
MAEQANHHYHGPLTEDKEKKWLKVGIRSTLSC